MPTLTKQELLAEAKAAYHELMTGNKPVEVRDSTGESVRYTPANASRLRNYILELEAEIAAEAAGTNHRRRPIRMQF